jgi:hypothetical protein
LTAQYIDCGPPPTALSLPQTTLCTVHLRSFTRSRHHSPLTIDCKPHELTSSRTIRTGEFLLCQRKGYALSVQSVGLQNHRSNDFSLDCSPAIPPRLQFLNGTRESGADVRTSNVTAALAIANIVKSSLGPVGLDKMLVDDIGDVTITNDGATILAQLEVDHPAGRVLVDLAQLQDREVGDGTTSVVIIETWK